jgi:hypothetical protein
LRGAQGSGDSERRIQGGQPDFGCQISAVERIRKIDVTIEDRI